MGSDELLDALRAHLGPKGFVEPGTNLSRYENDWSGDHRGHARAVLRPKSTAEVATIVRACSAAGAPLVPQGGHTGLVNGATPSADANELVLSLERMNRVRALDPDDFSMIAEGGCILADVKAAAERADLFFPLTLGAQGSCQIGGNISTNAGGLNVLRYGMTRDLVLGLEVVLPDGEVVEDLRCLRKNNTGYDLKQLFIGAEGTLGIVTAAALKLFPRPTQRETVLLGCPSLDAVVALFGRARRDLGDLVSAFELMTRPCLEAALEEICSPEPFSPPTPAYVLLEVATSARIALRPAIEAYLEDAMERGLVSNGAVAESEAHAGAFWRLREGLIEWQVHKGRHLRTDVALPISRVPAFIRAVEDAISTLDPRLLAHSYGHVGDGNIHINVVPLDVESTQTAPLLSRCEALIYEQVDAFRGTISAEHGIGRKKRPAFESRITPAARRLCAAIKISVDPAGILSPERMLSLPRNEKD